MGIFDYFKRLRAQKPPAPAPEHAKAVEPAHEGIVKSPEIPPPEPISARELSERLTYAKPLIISVGNDLREVPLGERSVGKFVVCARDDRVRLFGILYLPKKRRDMAADDVESRIDMLEQALSGPRTLETIKHKDFHHILSSIERSYLDGYGLELGGGELMMDFAAKKAVAQGFSGTFGRPPRSFVEKALAMDGYSIQVVMGESASPDPHDNPAAVEWFKRRGVTTGDPWSTE